jgi:NitT/TauT family transport system ATP-binding protein
VRGVVKIDLPRPHDRNDVRFKDLTDYLYTVMTNPAMEVASSEPAHDHEERLAVPAPAAASPIWRPLPHVRVGTISGLLELIVEMGTGQEIAGLAERLALPVDDFLSILDAAVLLGFAEVTAGCVTVTPVGRDFATTTILRSKDLFRHQALERVPILATITKTLATKANKSMRSDFFLDVLEEHYPAPEAQLQFDTAVDWGRYAELFEYDAEEERLSLHEATPAG